MIFLYYNFSILCHVSWEVFVGQGFFCSTIFILKSTFSFFHQIFSIFKYQFSILGMLTDLEQRILTFCLSLSVLIIFASHAMSTKCFTDHHHFTIIMKSRWNKYTDHIPDTVDQTRLILADGATSSHKSSQKLRDKKTEPCRFFLESANLKSL